MATRHSFNSQSVSEVDNEKPKTGLAANPYSPSSAAYLAYPVKHVVSSLYRRMTEPPERPVNRLLDAPTIPSKQSAGYTPPRRPSPFQPPPLTPLSLVHDLPDAQSEDLLLTKSLAEEIRLLVPARLQLVNTWKLAYSLDIHGSSLTTLYEQCDCILGPLGKTQRGGFVILVQDGSDAADAGAVFGAYLTDPPRPSQNYYGTGECFLWKASILPALGNITAQSLASRLGTISTPPSEDILELAGLPPPPSADTTHAQRATTVKSTGRRRSSAARSPTSPRRMAYNMQNGLLAKPTRGPLDPSGIATPDRIRFKAFPYSGVNDFMIYCETSFLSVGGGDGHHGLWLDHQLESGVSEACLTFGNEALSDQGKKFDVLGLEIWYLGS